MSKVMPDHAPARTTRERRAAPTPPPGRSRIEAGVLSLVLVGILVFAAGFAALFPESAGLRTFWPTYRDPSGSFELRYPRTWAAEGTPDGVVLRSDDAAMVVHVTVRTIEGTSVRRLAEERIAEVADVGAAEMLLRERFAVDGRATAGVRELTGGAGRETYRLFVDAGDATYVTVVATAPTDRFDPSTFRAILGTMRLPGPDESPAGDPVGQSRP